MKQTHHPPDLDDYFITSVGLLDFYVNGLYRLHALPMSRAVQEYRYAK